MCDCLVALSHVSEGPTLYAKNSDRPPAEPQRLEWHPAGRADSATTTRTTYLEVEAGDRIGVLGSRPDWMWGFEHGVNEAGVVCGNETIYTTLDPRPFPPALTGMDLVRLALERAETAERGVEVITSLIERYGQGGSGHRDADRPYWSSFLLADPRSAWVVETSGQQWAAERIDDSWAISNRTTIQAFDAAHRHPRQPVATMVDPRLEASRSLLASPPVTTSGLRCHLRSHDQRDDGWTVCMHVDGVEQTTASIIVELPPAGPPRAEVLAGSPCASVYVPLFVGCDIGVPIAWERFAGLHPLPEGRRQILDVLEAELIAEARADDDWAREAWQRVDRSLTAMGC